MSAERLKVTFLDIYRYLLSACYSAEMSCSEKTLVWKEIKKAAPAILKAAGNPVEILIKSQGKTVEEVKTLIEDYEEFNKKNNEILMAKMK